MHKFMKYILLFAVLFLNIQCSQSSRQKQVEDYFISIFGTACTKDFVEAIVCADTITIKEQLRQSPNLINYQERNSGLTILMAIVQAQSDLFITETMSEHLFKSFQYLIHLGANVNAVNKTTKETALTIACASPNIDICYIEELIDNDASVNYEVVKYCHNVDSLKSLFSLPKTNNSTPLIEASKCGRIDVVISLLESGADINYTNEMGCSALSESLIYNHLDVCLYLLKQNADYTKPIMKCFSVTDFENNNRRNDSDIYITNYLRYLDFPEYLQHYILKMQILEFVKTNGANCQE